MLQDQIIGFVFSFLSTLLLVPIVKSLGLQFNLVDKPGKRKQHKINIVRLGGVAIFCGFYFSIFLSLSIGFINVESLNLFWPVIFCAPLFFLIGLFDDITSLSPFLRLILQFTMAIFAWTKGIQIESFQIHSLFWDPITFNFASPLSLLITVFWIVGIINSINWMDGLDGLASGIIIIITIGLVINFLLLGNFEALLILFTLLGSCLAFLIYNLYPAKIVMGDGGSYLLGFLAATLSIYSFNLQDNLSKGTNLNFIQLLLIFAIPLFDMTIVIFSRLKANRSIFRPDRSHIHHRLLDLGFSHKNTVNLLFAFSQFFVCLSLLFIVIKGKYILFIISSLILLSSLISKCNSKKLFRFKIIPK